MGLISRVSSRTYRNASMSNDSLKIAGAAIAGAAAIGAIGAYFLLNKQEDCPEPSTKQRKSLTASIEEKYQNLEKTPNSLREKGNEYFKAKKYKKAIDVYTEALNLAILQQNSETNSKN